MITGSNKITRRGGLITAGLHDAWHSHDTLFLKVGVNPKVIQERLGHSSFSTTMNLYAHVSPEIQKEAADLFEGMVVKLNP